MMSGVWRHFQKHIVRGVKYGSCMDDECPSKRKLARRSEVKIGTLKLIRCTGGNTTNLWYHLEKDHPELHREEIAKRDNERRLRAEEEVARFKMSNKQLLVAASHFNKAGAKFNKNHPGQ